MKKTAILAIAIISIMLVSSLGLAINLASASPISVDLTGNRHIEKTWVRLNGLVKTWDTENVSGVIQTTARTTLLASDNSRQLTGATAIWTENTSRPINSVRSRENFTYVYYSARLNNASVSDFNVSTNSNYFLNGTWNIYTITSTITVVTGENNTIVSVHRSQDVQVNKAYGELNVTDNWTKFTLNIDGQNQLSGTIYRSLTRMIAFNPFAICEPTATKTSHADLRQVAGCIHAVPGWGGYDSQMDFNGNFKVDIADLSTVASNM